MAQKKSKYPKSIKDFKENPEFYEELAVLKAQEEIAGLMKITKTNYGDLAKLLNKRVYSIVDLFNGEKEISLRLFAKICFLLGYKLDYFTMPIDTEEDNGCLRIQHDGSLDQAKKIQKLVGKERASIHPTYQDNTIKPSSIASSNYLKIKQKIDGKNRDLVVNPGHYLFMSQEGYCIVLNPKEMQFVRDNMKVIGYEN